MNDAAPPAIAQRLRIEVRGQVQGVGFRPFVYRLAGRHAMEGWVRNDRNSVTIEVEGPPPQLEAFVRELRERPPPRAHIEGLRSWPVAADGRHGFAIHDSAAGDGADLSVPLDLALCEACRAELFDPASRRHRYPFIACPDCGPRWSALAALPYDRANTALAGFAPCPHCTAEYEDPDDRRFHAQNNACAGCGPQLELWDGNGAVLARREDALREAVQALRGGAVVAVKGLGGFHLMVDARNADAIAALRTRKQRPHKPLAVMLDGVTEIKRHCELPQPARAALCSPAAPIVLLRSRGTLPELIAPGNPWLGVMLPYTPLHQLLLRDSGLPLVATSGNRSGEPLCRDGDEALTRLRGIADLFLVHDRPILQPVDDSVVQLAGGRMQVLRCARGLAPLVLPGLESHTVTGMALGGHQKATLALGGPAGAVVSPHVGDLDSVEAVAAYRHLAETLPAMLGLPARPLACDGHPDYRTSAFAHESGSRVLAVQHHHAHVAAVMAEHALDGEVLGVTWDGTGLGDDDTLWGGEFLLATRTDCRRVASLREFLLPGGEAAMREPRRAALGLLHAAPDREAGALLEHSFTTRERTTLQQMLARGVQCVRTSSAGRLFDAVAALLGLHAVTTFEGQAAMALQFAAERHQGAVPVLAFPLDRGVTPWRIDWSPVLGLIRQRGQDTTAVAAAFHRALAAAIAEVAAAFAPRPVVLAGGCFQNRLLLELSLAALRARGCEAHLPLRLPPNDGALALGQLAVAQACLEGSPCA